MENIDANPISVWLVHHVLKVDEHLRAAAKGHCKGYCCSAVDIVIDCEDTRDYSHERRANLSNFDGLRIVRKSAAEYAYK